MAKGKTFKGFSDEQMKRIAGKLGFNGPVEKFGQFLQSNPAMAAKYAGLEAKAKMKFAEGGMAQPTADKTIDPAEMERLREATKAHFDLNQGRSVVAPKGPFNPNNVSVRDAAKLQQANAQMAQENARLAQQNAGAGANMVPATVTAGPPMTEEQRKQLEDKMRAMQGQAQGQPQMQVAQPFSGQMSAEEQMQRIPEWLPQEQKDRMRNQILFNEQNADEIKKLDSLANTVGVKSQEILRKYGYDPGQITEDQQNSFPPEMQAELDAAAAEFQTASNALNAKFNAFTRENMQQPYTGVGAPTTQQYVPQQQPYGPMTDPETGEPIRTEIMKEVTNEDGTTEMVGTGEYEYQMPTIGDISGQRMFQPGLPEGGTQLAQQIAVSDEQKVAEGTGQVTGDRTATTTLAGTTQEATAGTKPTTKTYTADTVAGTTGTTVAAEGTVGDKAQVTAQQGALSEGALATAPTFDEAYTQQVQAGERTVTEQELAAAAGQNVEAIKSEIAQSDALAEAVAQQGYVKPEELPPPAKINEDNIVQAEAIVAAGLDDNAIAVAERMNKFSVDDGTLAKFEQGEVDARATVQQQLTNLMKSFDDGTPAWAAGAIRAANAAMAARGLGSSSMAGAAILQATMESAIPIAQQDAQTFAEMGITNVNNKQKVALENAAAQQGVELRNFDARQAAALANSNNAFQLQIQNLSNQQQTVIANAQIKAAMQGQNLTNEQQSNLAIAARFAESANLNLSNLQQTELQNNLNGLQTNLANLSSKQQSYITNANLAATLQGQVISNEQQTAIANAARFADANNMTFTADQQAQLHNSSLMQSIGLANLNSKQASVLQNAATLAGMDMANLNNRQQAAVLNAKAFLDMDMANLTNDQQAIMFDAQSRVQALFSDQAAENAAKNFNAASENQTEQFFTQLSATVSQHNSTQNNAMAMFDAEEANDIAQFNAEIGNERDQFNANNELLIEQSFAQWNRDVATANTAAVNVANQNNAQAILDVSETAYANMFSLYADSMEYAWTSGENERDRVNNIALARLRGEIELSLAEFMGDQQAISDLGGFLADVALGVGSKKGWLDLGGLIGG